MKRRTFDKLVSTAGIALVVVLVAAGALLFWGYSFANNNVQQQLNEQKITMPSGEAIQDARIKPYLAKYAGQPLVNGAQAEAYANHFIKVHVSDIGKGTPYAGMTFAQLGAYQRAHPEDTTVGPARDTVFKGETLRGLLLNAYAFWKIGQLARIGSFVAFGTAALLAVLVILGFVHARRVSPEVELMPAEPRIRVSA